tara:strand:- start:145 stop:474 length:330 start_codon:yes stop_codon:yes gene_type:complete
MASEIKVLRLSTGEDVIAKVDQSSGENVELDKPFVIIPQQLGPGKPIQLMMSLYNAFGKSEKVTLNKDKIVFITDPKDEILKSYEANTSKIITPKSSLITETNIPTLKK